MAERRGDDAEDRRGRTGDGVKAHAGAERRRRTILAAARAMLRREPLSMRRLAAEAGVSQATPYNLFGSKRRLALALHLELEAELMAQVRASGAADALDRMYTAIRLTAEAIEAEAPLYRALFAIIYTSDAEGEEVRSAAAFWDALIPPLHAEGLIEAGADVPAFTRNFVYLLSGALIEWADRRIDTPALLRAVRYGFTLAALGLATETSRARLRAAL